MRKALSFTLIILVLFTGIGYSDDSLEGNLRSVLIGDFESGEILYEHNIDEVVEMASITKVMTYLVAMDEVSKGTVSLNDTVTIGKNPTRIGGASLYLKAGEKINLKTLIEATMIVSGNDGCIAIAEHIYGSEEEYVKEMNIKAKEIGINSANFINTSGMPVNNDQNKMSTRDIFKLSSHVISKYPQILKITDSLNVEIPSRNFRRKNTNPLLPEIDEVDGLKTGYTNAAGYCLVSTMVIPKSDKNYEDFRVIAIVMGGKSSDSRKYKSIDLLNYAKDNYTKKLILNKENVIDTITIKNTMGIGVNVYPKEDLVKLLKEDDVITSNVVIKDELKAPLSKGDVVGKVSLFKDDEAIGEIDLVINEDVSPASFLMRFFSYLENLILKIWEVDKVANLVYYI